MRLLGTNWLGAKWDVLASDTDPEKRKNLCRARGGSVPFERAPYDL